MENRRLDYLDVSKGLAILCIVFFHTTHFGDASWLYKWLRSFSVMIFYVISGYILACRNKDRIPAKEYMKKRGRSLIVPYGCFSLIILVFDAVLVSAGFYEVKQIAKDLFMTLSFRGIGTLWFLPSLFIGEAAVFALRSRKSGSPAVCGFVCAVSASLLGLTVSRLDSGSLKSDVLLTPLLVLAKGLFAASFIAVGCYVYRLHTALRARCGRKLIMAAGLCCLVIGFFPAQLNRMTDINHVVIGNPVWFYAGAVLGSAGWIFITGSLGGRGLVSGVFRFYGKNSLIVMITHYSLLMPAISAALGGLGKGGIGKELYQVLCFALVVLIEIPVIAVINRYLSFLIRPQAPGRRPAA